MQSDRQWLIWRVLAVSSALAAVGDLCWNAWLAGQRIIEIGVPLGPYLAFSALWAVVAAWGLVQFRKRPWFWVWLAVTGWNAILVAVFPVFVRFTISMT